MAGHQRWDKASQRGPPDRREADARGGVGISGKGPKLLTPEMLRIAEVGVVVCGEPESSTCPALYTRYVEHWEVPNPAWMSLEEARRVRDEIKRGVADLVERIKRGRFRRARALA